MTSGWFFLLTFTLYCSPLFLVNSTKTAVCLPAGGFISQPSSIFPSVCPKCIDDSFWDILGLHNWGYAPTSLKLQKVKEVSVNRTEKKFVRQLTAEYERCHKKLCTTEKPDKNICNLNFCFGLDTDSSTFTGSVLTSVPHCHKYDFICCCAPTPDFFG